jgi:hypothetical protein
MNVNICISRALLRALSAYGGQRLFQWRFRTARARMRQARLRRFVLA